MAKEKWRVIGLMSGTSLDGLDIACCEFEHGTSWTYKIIRAETIRYPAPWRKRLTGAHLLSGEDLAHLDAAYGRWLGNTCLAFVKRHRLRPDLIASHGHTVFHQPDKGFTLQIGNGNAIHALTGIPVVYDFRTLDVMLGGEGAPLVPIGDRMLFSDYEVCLNLGGIANLSADVKGARRAFDICFCNMAFNYLANEAGKSMDKDGAIAQKGDVNRRLLTRLDRLYTGFVKARPSLGREIFERRFQPLLADRKIPLGDRMRTSVESTAAAIAHAILSTARAPSVLCTGGGALNAFLVSRMLEHVGDQATLVVADQDVVAFKEALIFAFLGALRARGEINTLKSVTRASRDSSGGVVVGL